MPLSCVTGVLHRQKARLPPDAVDGVHGDIPETENQRAEPGA